MIEMVCACTKDEARLGLVEGIMNLIFCPLYFVL